MNSATHIGAGLAMGFVVLALTCVVQCLSGSGLAGPLRHGSSFVRSPRGTMLLVVGFSIACVALFTSKSGHYLDTGTIVAMVVCVVPGAVILWKINAALTYQWRRLTKGWR